MDCKNALSESERDIIKAHELLRKKGLASADKKATRATAEGRIGSYIHDSRIGVLVEMQKEDLASKPEQIRSRIVEGWIRKRLEDLALLEQPYIMNEK